MTDHFPTITRAELIEAAERTMTLARTLGVTITSEQEHCYMEVARRVDLITQDWVAQTGLEEEPQCGCLVGTLRLKRGLNPNLRYLFDGRHLDGDDLTDKEVGRLFPTSFISAIPRHKHKALSQVFRVED